MPKADTRSITADLVKPTGEPASRLLNRAPNPHQAPPVSIATRRDLFGTMGAMLLLTAAEAGPAKAAELDGELLACCAELQAADRDLAAAEADASVDVEDIGPFCDRRDTLVAAVTALPARTPEGLRCKAEALRATLAADVPGAQPNGFWDEVAQPHERLAMSLCRDLLGRVGA